MKNKFLLLLLIPFILLTSCNDDENCCLPLPEDLPYDEGILILNEGNFGSGNASVSYISNASAEVSLGIFNTVNSQPLGDIGQSIAIDDELAFIILNNSQKIEIVDRYTFESIATISSGLLNPRYAAFANDKMYVTNWGDGTNATDDYVAVINLGDYSVEDTIPVVEGPEKILADGNNLYVLHAGGYNQNNVVSMIDAEGVVETIPVGDVPNSMQLIGDHLWVLCGGKPGWTNDETSGELVQLNTTEFTVSNSFQFAQTEHPDHLSEDGGQLYYVMNNAVYVFDPATEILPDDFLFEGVNFYEMTVSNENIYATDALDYTSAGDFLVYDLEGNQLQSLKVGIIPTGIYFN